MRTEGTLETKADRTIARFKMLTGGEKVVVSVSGGPDSMSLLTYLNNVREELDLKLYVFHIDHMFRGEESAKDADAVEQFASNLDLPFKRVQVNVPAILRETDASPQDVARRVRLENLRAYTAEVEADRIALGHTADDQVETFLMRVIQGAGLTGLGGMSPVVDKIIRPLIYCWRKEIEEYARRLGLAPRMDSSNLNQVYLRNHIRMRLIPYLSSEFGKGVKEVILREVESLAADREYMELKVLEAYDEIARPAETEIRLDANKLAALHSSLQRGVLREAWCRLLPEETFPSWQNIADIIEKVVGGVSGARLDLPHGVVVEREYDDIVLRAPLEDDDEEEQIDDLVELDLSGTAELPWCGCVMTASSVPASEVALQGGSDVEFVRADVPFPLTVRTPRPGDRFKPLGSSGTRKLSDFFIDIKLPRRERARCPVVVSGDDVVWVVGHRLDDRFKLEEGSEAVRLFIEESGAQGEE
jgi:tRNA(Ile)-lysidine synthase